MLLIHTPCLTARSASMPCRPSEHPPSALAASPHPLSQPAAVTGQSSSTAPCCPSQWRRQQRPRHSDAARRQLRASRMQQQATADQLKRFRAAARCALLARRPHTAVPRTRSVRSRMQQRRQFPHGSAAPASVLTRSRRTWARRTSLTQPPAQRLHSCSAAEPQTTVPLASQTGRRPWLHYCLQGTPCCAGCCWAHSLRPECPLGMTPANPQSGHP